MRYIPPIRSTNVRRPVLSPIQKEPFNMAGGINEIIVLVRDLNTLKNELTQTQKSTAEALDKKLGEAEAILAHIKSIQKGEPGKNAEIDYEYVISEVQRQIRTPEDGVSPEVDYNKIIDAVVAKIPKPKAQKEVKVDYKYIIAELKNQMGDQKAVDPMEIIDVIMNLPEGKRLSTKHIDGLEQTISAMRSQLARGYLHGGGDTVAAGSGISISTNSDGSKVITSTGGGGFTTLTPTETVDGVLTVFTFSTATAQPSFMLKDNVMTRATSSTGTVYWTWDNTAKQVTFVTPPQDDLVAIK